MNHTTNDKNSPELLQAQIQTAFPAYAFFGSITRVDGVGDEVLDDELALYGELRGRKWSEIPASFLRVLPDGFLLLTDEAFVAFLASWLICALKEAEIREMVVYAFSPDVHDSANWKVRHILLLNSPQREAIRGFLAYCVDIESSEYLKRHAQLALEFITAIP